MLRQAVGGTAARKWDADFFVPYFDVTGDKAAPVCVWCYDHTEGCARPHDCPYEVENHSVPGYESKCARMHPRRL